MPKKCNKPGCKYNQFGGGFCKSHQYMRTDKKQKKLRPFTPKRQKINVEYNEKAAMFREANPVCKINSPVCTRFTQGVHHVKGKSTIGLLLDENFWKPACNACNGYIEDNSAWAKENGHKVPNYK